MPRKFTPKVVTANRLLEGDAVWLTADGRWTPDMREAELLDEEAHAELSDVREAQMATFKRTYTDAEVAQLSTKEKKAYDKKLPAFRKKLQRLQVQRA